MSAIFLDYPVKPDNDRGCQRMTEGMDVGAGLAPVRRNEMSNVIVIPRRLVFVRFVEVPSTNDSEIKKMVEFQAIKEIPHPKEEMITGYRNLGSYRDGFSSIMLAIANRDTIENIIHDKERLKLRIQSIRLNTELVFLYLSKKGLVNVEEVTFIVHITEEDVETMVVDRNRPVFSRGFKKDNRFLNEIDHSVLAYKRDKNNHAIENIIVPYNKGVDIECVRSYIDGHLKIPASFYEFSDALEDLYPSAQIELLPKEIIEKRIVIEKRQESFVTYCLVGLIVVLSFTFIFLRLYGKKKLFNMIAFKTEKIQSETKTMKELVEKIALARANESMGKFIVEVCEASYNLVPVDISLLGLSYDGGKGISYKGYSKDMSFIFAFVKELERSKYFDKVEMKYVTKKIVKGEELIDFDIQCKIKKESER